MALNYFWEFLKNSSQSVVLYGTGNGADKLIDKLDEMNIDICGIFASDGFVRSRSFRGYPVESFDDIKKRISAPMILLAFGSDRADVLHDFKRLSQECAFYAPWIPLFEEGIPSGRYTKAEEIELENTFNLLCDEQSRRVFENILKYRYSADISYLLACESSVAEAYGSILQLSENEVYLDVGAYRGDTAAEFISMTGDYKKIYACEPNKRSFKKLEEYALNQKDMECFRVFVGDENSFVKFSSNNGRGSTQLNSGDEVAERTIDTLLEGDRISYMKIDSEGMEKKVINGAKSTIAKHHPKMRIASYHLKRDIVEIPKQVLSICGDYKVYMRHYPAIPDWNTDFYFI